MEYYQYLYDLLGKGYKKVRIDGNENLRESITLSKNAKHETGFARRFFAVHEFKDVR